MLWNWTSGYEETKWWQSSMWKKIWFLLNIDMPEDREVSIHIAAVLYNVAYFEVII